MRLNTEKAPNLKDRSLEVIRMARALVELGDPPESQFENEFEEPSLLTLGLCYQENGRFAGAVYHPVLNRIEQFLGAPLPKARRLRPRHSSSTSPLSTITRASRHSAAW